MFRRSKAFHLVIVYKRKPGCDKVDLLLWKTRVRANKKYGTNCLRTECPGSCCSTSFSYLSSLTSSACTASNTNALVEHNHHHLSGSPFQNLFTIGFFYPSSLKCIRLNADLTNNFPPCFLFFTDPRSQNYNMKHISGQNSTRFHRMFQSSSAHCSSKVCGFIGLATVAVCLTKKSRSRFSVYPYKLRSAWMNDCND
jgi:hypothetical protein